MLEPPCKDCTTRVVGCHSTCRMYKQYKKDFEKTRQRRKEYFFNKGVIVESILRCKRD